MSRQTFCSQLVGAQLFFAHLGEVRQCAADAIAGGDALRRTTNHPATATASLPAAERAPRALFPAGQLQGIFPDDFVLISQGDEPDLRVVGAYVRLKSVTALEMKAHRTKLLSRGAGHGSV